MLTIKQWIKANPKKDGSFHTETNVQRRCQRGSLESFKRNGNWYIGKPSDSAPTELLDNEALKNKKMAVEIQKIEQQIKEKQDQIREEFKGEVMEIVTSILLPLRKELAKVSMTDAEYNRIKECINKALKQLG